MSYPTWQTNSTNVQRADAIVKQMASLFANNPQVVSMIEPVNEHVSEYRVSRFCADIPLIDRQDMMGPRCWMS